MEKKVRVLLLTPFFRWHHHSKRVIMPGLLLQPMPENVLLPQCLFFYLAYHKLIIKNRIAKD